MLLASHRHVQHLFDFSGGTEVANGRTDSEERHILNMLAGAQKNIQQVSYFAVSTGAGS